MSKYKKPLNSNPVKEFHLLLKNLESLTQNQASIHSYDPDDISTFTIKVTPKEGLYKNAKFIFSIKLDKYPKERPTVACLTDIYHPNIQIAPYQWNHSLCLNLFDSWNKSFGIVDVIQGIIFLFYQPNLDDPYSQMFTKCSQEEFNLNVHRSLHGGTVNGYTFSPNPGIVDYERNLALEQADSHHKEDYIETVNNNICPEEEILETVACLNEANKENYQPTDINNESDKSNHKSKQENPNESEDENIEEVFTTEMESQGGLYAEQLSSRFERILADGEENDDESDDDSYDDDDEDSDDFSEDSDFFPYINDVDDDEYMIDAYFHGFSGFRRGATVYDDMDASYFNSDEEEVDNDDEIDSVESISFRQLSLSSNSSSSRTRNSIRFFHYWNRHRNQLSRNLLTHIIRTNSFNPLHPSYCSLFVQSDNRLTEIPLINAQVHLSVITMNWLRFINLHLFNNLSATTSPHFTNALSNTCVPQYLMIGALLLRIYVKLKLSYGHLYSRWHSRSYISYNSRNYDNRRNNNGFIVVLYDSF